MIIKILILLAGLVVTGLIASLISYKTSNTSKIKLVESTEYYLNQIILNKNYKGKLKGMDIVISPAFNTSTLLLLKFSYKNILSSLNKGTIFDENLLSNFDDSILELMKEKLMIDITGFADLTEAEIIKKVLEK